MNKTDKRNPTLGPSYANLKNKESPATESLKDTLDRVLPYWYETIQPALKAGKQVLVAAHGNSLRAIVKYLDNMSSSEIMGVDIPTGFPLVYELDEGLNAIRHYYLGDREEIRKAREVIARQISVKEKQ